MLSPERCESGVRSHLHCQALWRAISVNPRSIRVAAGVSP